MTRIVDKFKEIVTTKNKFDHITSGLLIENDSVTIEQSLRTLEIILHNQLNFNLRIRKICKSATNQLRLEGYLGLGEKKVLINSFMLSNYCPLFWFTSSVRSLNNHSSYDKFLQKSGKVRINLKN